MSDPVTRADTAGVGAIWEEIQSRNSLVFQFPTGGDGVLGIAWSESDQRFYRLWECC